jgi:hypothetical protein
MGLDDIEEDEDGEEDDGKVRNQRHRPRQGHAGRADSDEESAI